MIALAITVMLEKLEKGDRQTPMESAKSDLIH